jgi:hypothetical protein
MNSKLYERATCNNHVPIHKPFVRNTGKKLCVREIPWEAMENEKEKVKKETTEGDGLKKTK